MESTSPSPVHRFCSTPRRLFRTSGADLPFGHPEWRHDVAMEGYFWRITDPASDRVLIALIGVQTDATGRWALAGVGTSDGAWHQEILPEARARERGLGAHGWTHGRAEDALPDKSHQWAANPGATGAARPAPGVGTAAGPGTTGGPGTTDGPGMAGTPGMAGGCGARSSFFGTDRRLRVELGSEVRLDLHLSDLVRWPMSLSHPFGGSSWFQTVPGLNQYWHPWALGGRASGTALVDGQRWDLTDAQVYGEKNWGRAGFPDSWWWGQSQGFTDPDACVAFAGGQVIAGPWHTEVTALAVRLPGGRLLRLGNPGTSPVRARIGDGEWSLEGRMRNWTVTVEARAALESALILPVPLVGQRSSTPGDIEHLTADLHVRVEHRGRPVWTDESHLAGVEHGGLERASALVQYRHQQTHAPT